jgi:hypothetical protein
MVSLTLELVSRNLRRTPSSSSALERQEYARRDRDLFWYLFRGSIWESWTRYASCYHSPSFYSSEYLAFIDPNWNRSPKVVHSGLY